MLPLSSGLLAVTCSALSILILSYATTKTQRLWGVFNIAVAVWGMGICLATSTQNKIYSFHFWQYAHFGGLFVSSLFFDVTCSFCGVKKNKFTLACYAVATLFLILSFFNITGYEVQDTFIDALYMRANNYIYVLISMLWAIPLLYGNYLLVKKILIVQGAYRKQLIILFTSMMVGFVGGIQHFLPAYGIDFYPNGNFLITMYAILASYAIFKHKLLDMQVIIKRATVFAILFAFVYGIFSVCTFLSNRFFENVLQWSGPIAMVPTLIIITFSLRPLEDLLTHVTNKFLFQKKYDYKELLRIFTTEVITYLDLDKVVVNTVSGLDNIIKLEAVSIWIKNENDYTFKLVSYRCIPPDVDSITDRSLVAMIGKARNYIMKDDLKDVVSGGHGCITNLLKMKAEVVLPIIFRQDLIGLVALGAKKSGDAYHSEELPILMSIASTVGIAISNAKLYAQLSQTQAEAAQSEKMAVIGTLASGINHEICNPLGIVRGHCEVFLLNFKDGLYKNIDKDKLLDQVTKTYEKIINQIDRATGITKRLSAFAKPNKLFKKEPIDVGSEVEEVLQILAHEMRIHNIEVKNALPANYPKIMCDKKQIQEVMFNIIRNAAQAMQGNGRIQIDGARNGVRAWINIKDTGPGITPEQQAKIFHPFFTTKQPGEGTGLGLYIVKQIVEKNDGTIELSSTPGEGATFKLTFQIAEEEQVFS